MSIYPINANMTELRTEKMIVLFSYKTPVAVSITGAFYKTAKHHSPTTTRHINQWLRGIKAEEKPQSFFDALID